MGQRGRRSTRMRMDVIEGFPLSPQQKHLWSLQQADHSMAYHAQCSILIEGSLDSRILKSALRQIVNRHEVLRTYFPSPPGNICALQAVGAEVMVSIREFNLSGCDPRRQEAAISKLYARSSKLAFDLPTGPPLHVSMLTLSRDRHLLFVNASSLCIDQVSLTNLVREIGRYYCTDPNCDELFDTPLQYADAAQWQNDLLQSEDSQEGRKYWRERNRCDFLPQSFPGYSVGSTAFRPQFSILPVKPELASSIVRVARNYEIAVPIFMLACWQTLLWRLTGQSEFVIGMACDCRTYEGLEEAIGLFRKTLPIICDLAASDRFSALLQRVHGSVSDAVGWQEYFGYEESPTSERAARSPSFLPFAFEFVEGYPKHVVGELSFSIQKLYACSDRFSLKLLSAQKENCLVNELHYDSGSFRTDNIERLHREFQTLLESVVRDPEAEIASFEVVGETDRQQLLIEFNHINTHYSKDRSLHQLFEEQVERTPDNVAVSFQGQRLTYAQLNARANQLAHQLQKLGVGPDVPVAICMERCLEMVVGILGVLKAGGAYVPLDPEYPKERLAYMLKDVQAEVLLTQEYLAVNLPCDGLQVLRLDSGWESIAQNSAKNLELETSSTDLAYVIYTSGSTGWPKGVMVEHGGLANAVNWITEALELSVLDSCLLKTPITFDAAGREIFPTLLSGGKLVVAEPNGHRDCHYLLETIRRERITILHCVPSLLRLLVEEPEFDETLPLRAVMCGGEALARAIITGFHGRARAKLYNVYGPTEAIIDSTYWPCENLSEDSVVPIGRPIPNARVFILDHLLRVVPIGVAGVLYIGGAGLARGYVNRPDLTAEKFIPDPFSNDLGARLYNTGDLARYRADGNIEYLGRDDSQVKIRGFRIELGEIEKTLAGHPSVRGAIVVVQEGGPDEHRLVAYVAAQEQVCPNAEELRALLRERLPEYMVPAVFVVMDAFPLTANGKLDRRALPVYDRSRSERDEKFVATRTPTEDLLTQIWSQVLGLERIGIYDNFFRLGGHSLLATQVVSRIRQAFQVEMPLRRLFETPTVASLAESIDRDGGAGLQVPPIVPIIRDGDLPLSFAQQRIWFIDQLEPGNSAYNFPAAVHLKGPLNLVALKQSLNEIIKRHEVLRTTFRIVEGRPVQVVAPRLMLDLPIVDLEWLPEAERKNEIQRLATIEAQRPFDLNQGPLVRATVLRLCENEHVGLLTMHHIVADGWSSGILIREMAILYECRCSGKPSPLPELPIQYADFAQWQRQWLKDEVLETQLIYWKKQLLGAPPLLELLTDHPRPAAQSFRGAQESLLLPKKLGDDMKALSRQQGVTYFMTLLAVFQILLQSYTNQDDFVIGTPIANRNRLEIEGLIGFFVNTLVLRADLSGDPNFRELLVRVREVCLGAYAHQDLPFERLVEELHLTRDPRSNPLFQAMFVLQNVSIETVNLPGMSLTPLETDVQTTHFDLTLHIADTEQGLATTLAYNTDLFEAVTIGRMLGHFRNLLEAVTDNPETRLSALVLLSTSEQKQLLVEWNNTEVGHTDNLCVQQLFEIQVDRTPEAVAVISANERITYSELNRRCNQLANHLRTLGLGPEVAVGICLNHSIGMVIALLGTLKAGGVYLPMDSAHPKERLAFMLEDAEVRVVLTQSALLAELPEHNAKVVCLDSDWESVSRSSTKNSICRTSPENLAYTIYTSGSTGRPKGVLVSHAAAVEHCISIQEHYELNADDKVLQFGSASFDLSLEQILPTLIVGATLVMLNSEAWQVAEFHKKVSEHGINVLNISTGYWQELAREWADRVELAPNIEPRVFIVGGDAMLPEFLDLWQRTPMKSVRLINAYGPTETTITATAFDVGAGPHEPASRQRIPVGRPLANRKTYILNRFGNVVPVGVAGELYIGGACLARGYLNRADLTAANFTPDSFSDRAGARLYKTGDVARYLADGNIEFLGRTDNQVKIRGFRIEPEEIEAVLRRHQKVRETIVLAREKASGERQLVAYIVTQRESSPATASELLEFLREKLPDYMIPSVFVPLDDLPLMASGKVNRVALPDPDVTRSEHGKGFVAPRNPLELQLANLWEEVLGIRPIGVTDNFFELGGHSLAAVRLFALIEKRLGKKVPLATVFQGPTVEHLANILRQQATSATPRSSLVAIQPAGNRRPLFLIHPAGGHVFPYVHLAHYLGTDQPCYGLQARGLEEGNEPQSRIEEMATYYIEALRTVQPAGPYLIGGWSMGGVVAFEMAQQLHARGERVALLALLDARIPTADDEVADEDFEARLLIDFVRYFGLSMDPRDALARLPKHELLERVLEHAKMAGLMPADIEVSHAQPFIDLCKADFRATRNYVLSQYPGRITLFKAGQDLAGTSSDPTLGWNNWAAGGTEVHIVPGNHATMVYKPHVEVLAQELRACLDQLRASEDMVVDEADTLLDSRGPSDE